MAPVARVAPVGPVGPVGPVVGCNSLDAILLDTAFFNGILLDTVQWQFL